MGNIGIVARATLVTGTFLLFFASSVAAPLFERVDVGGIIHQLANDIRNNYVFPEKGEEAAEMLEENADNGVYEGLEGIELAQRLTADLQKLTGDRHFGIRPAPTQAPSAPVQVMPEKRGTPISRIERLDGNIGYVDFRGFEMRERIEPQIHAMMKILEGSDALIFDLRKNGGGDPATVQLICSYLFAKDKPVHLNSLYFRPADETTEFWTEPKSVKGDGFAETPVWVLTSSFTFSGAEEFTYNLKTRKRATVVGETTGGGAHPVNGFRVGDFVAMIPVGRAINPITGKNWEGTGVEPDIKVEAAKALDVAITSALDTLAKSDKPEIARAAEWAKLAHRTNADTVNIDESAMKAIAGNYGPRTIEYRDGQLWYSRPEASAGERLLIPIKEDVFIFEGVQGFQLEIDRASDGSIEGLKGIYEAGHTDYSKRGG